MINPDTHVSQNDTDKMLIEWMKYNAEFINERNTQRTNFIKENIVDNTDVGGYANIAASYNNLFTFRGFYDFITADDIPNIILYANDVFKNKNTLRIFKDIFTVENYNNRKKNRDDGMGEKILPNNFGLRNNKSSFCFLHSIIQLLFDIPELITKLSGTEYDKLPMSLSEEHKPNIIIRMLSNIIKYITANLGKRLFLGDVKFTLSENEFHAVSILMKLLSKDKAGMQQDAGEFLVFILKPFISHITSDNIFPDVENTDDVSRITSGLVQTAVGNSDSEYVALSVQPINITEELKTIDASNAQYKLIGVIRKGIGHFTYMHINSFNGTNVSVNHFDDSQINYDEDKKITDFEVSALLYKKEEVGGFSLFDGGGGGGGGGGRHSRRMRKIKKTHRSTRTRHPSHS